MDAAPPRTGKRTIRNWIIALTITALIVLILRSVMSPSHSSSVARALGEIKMLETAAECCKADKGAYPSDPASTDLLNPDAKAPPSSYIPAAKFLFKSLTGSTAPGREIPEALVYIVGLDPRIMKVDSDARAYFVDPWGNPYGYSTLKARNPSGSAGYKTEFDLWTTGNSDGANQENWFKNW